MATNTAGNANTSAVNTAIQTPWHVPLLWFLGAIVALAVSGVAPNVVTMVLIIIMFSLLVTHWQDTYAPFLGLH